MTTITAGRSVGVLWLAFAAIAGGAAHAQPPPGPPPPFDAAARSAAVASAAAAFRSRYVSPAVGERAAATIEAALKRGDYDSFAQPQAFAEKLTSDLRAVTNNDQHVQVLGGGPPPGTPAPVRSEGGVVRADKLAGNIGYLNVSTLGPPALFNPALDRAMTALKGTTALIVDARSLQGGTVPSVSYLVSYFIKSEKPVHLYDLVSRNPDTETFRTQEFYSVATPFSYSGKVVLLTSKSTLSAGESVVYNLQALKRGTVVGEATAGGSNAAQVLPLGPGLALMLSGGRQQNAITGTNWEGSGVKPDVVTPSADALRAALDHLGQKTAGTTIDALSAERVFAPRTTPQAGTEAAVRRMSDENARGEPNYDLLSPEMGEATRPQVDMLKKIFSDLGPMKSVKFVEVGPLGADIYEAEYEKGSLMWQILLGPDGKTVMAGVRPLPPKR